MNVPHNDPFDRMLIVQARRANAPIITCDEAIEKFALETIW
jgi:PIN domain nuclease of toxin-antitoxin system